MSVNNNFFDVRNLANHSLKMVEQYPLNLTLAELTYQKYCDNLDGCIYNYIYLNDVLASINTAVEEKCDSLFVGCIPSYIIRQLKHLGFEVEKSCVDDWNKDNIVPVLDEWSLGSKKPEDFNDWTAINDAAYFVRWSFL